jgi:endonuclease-3
LYGRAKRSGRRSPPLDSLIGTLLSQNTNDQNSYRAWVNLRKKFPSWENVAAAPWQSVAAAIKVGGLKNQKARRIKEILRRVHRDWGAYSLSSLRRKTDVEVMDYLLSMKGIGEKTAACVLVFSLNREVFPVDTHIHRICNRLGFVSTRSAEETFHGMQSMVPAGKSYSFHVNLIQFGREVCRSSKPLCKDCPLFDECVFLQKHEYAESSTGVSRRSKASRDFFVTEHLSRNRN